jgi:hypothetical protein
MSDIPPGIDAIDEGYTISAADFPLSPVEAWLIMRGYWVRPKTPVTVDRLLTLPGILEMSDGYIGLHNK